MSGWQLFWWLMAVACMTWYSTVTVYVGIRGALDIREMLARLADVSADSDGDTDTP